MSVFGIQYLILQLNWAYVCNTREIRTSRTFLRPHSQQSVVLDKHNVYYSDFVPFAHNPPGHTCGLLCCNNDLHIHLKLCHHGGCMGLPFNQQNESNSGGSENFTIRRNQARLISGKPTFKNGGFYLAQPLRKQNKRRPVPTFGTVGQTGSGLSDIQRHFLQGRGITVPRCSESTTDISTKPRNDGNTISDSSSESEIEAHTKIHQSFSDSDTSNGVRKIYPWKLLRARLEVWTR